jgi:hypothetical protein
MVFGTGFLNLCGRLLRDGPAETPANEAVYVGILESYARYATPILTREEATASVLYALAPGTRSGGRIASIRDRNW